MSFSSNCKEELIRIRVKNAEQRLSQLSGMKGFKSVPQMRRLSSRL